ncbi:MAG: HAMP domain-containing sensor histidine kinase [Bacteroidota bacterium]
MIPKLSFRQRLFISYTVIFVIFTLLVLVFQFQREKGFRKSQLESQLDHIAVLTHNFIRSNSIVEEDFGKIDSLVGIIPGLNIRITVINPEGVVMYDSEVGDYISMENHLQRPEVRESVASEFGANIRKSSTTGNSYYYYAKYYSDFFIRTAALYDIRIKDFLHVEKLFVTYIVSLFLFIALLLLVVTKRFSDTINRLKDFAIMLSSGKAHDSSKPFPDDELGEIGQRITTIYEELLHAKEEIQIEKEKLFSRLNALNEGIAFFSPEKKRVLTNNQFIQNLNLISDISTISAEKIFEIAALEPIVRFIDQQQGKPGGYQADDQPRVEIDLQKEKRYFNVKCIFFQDNSFEIVITDTTKLEKRKMFKQQMTSNISHELKTPVATVMGYLETLQQNNLNAEKQKYFIDKAYSQAKRLSNLIEDISTLNKIEEAGSHYAFEAVNIQRITMEVKENMQKNLDENRIKVNIDLPGDMVLQGNQSLLFSVFYNLFDNVIKYGGEKTNINLTCYLEDDKFYYFSFSNTGTKIDEKHLSRIFERFYRIDDGRSRKTGGTGLGLAIVKNAIMLHGGTISARQDTGKGLEFLFSLKK